MSVVTPLFSMSRDEILCQFSKDEGAQPRRQPSIEKEDLDEEGEEEKEWKYEEEKGPTHNRVVEEFDPASVSKTRKWVSQPRFD